MPLFDVNQLSESLTGLWKGGFSPISKDKKKRKVWRVDPSTCMTLSEVKAFLKAARKRKTKNKSGMKDWIYIVLGMNTGLRISETAALKCRDMVLSGAAYPHVYVENGKGGKDRRVPLNEQTLEALIEYLEIKESWGEETEGDEPFLRSPVGDPHYTRFGLYEAFKRVLKLVEGVNRPERFHPHSMRHTFATHLYKASDHNIRLVQEILGHSSSVVTEVYTFVFNEDRSLALDRLYG